MPYLVNKSQRVVEVDGAQHAEDLIKQGFRSATREEIRAYRASKNVSAFSDGEGLFFHPNDSSKPDGYGQSTSSLTSALTQQGIAVSHKYSGQKVGMVYSYPHALELLQTDEKILYSMFESTKIPESWGKYLKLADRIFVPSKFCKEAFASRGFEAEVVPLGYNHHDFFYEEHEKPEIFTFLMYNAFDQRKGWDIAFKAFHEEFGKDPNVRLVLKTTKSQLPFPLPRSEYPNIDVVRGRLSLKELRELIQEAHCFVFPSRGEGFGLTPLEALACGTPSIIPNASGMAQYFDPEYFMDIELEGERAAIYERFDPIEVGNMVEPSLQDLKKKMRWAYENQSKIAEMGLNGAKWVRETYTIDHTAKKFAEVLGDSLRVTSAINSESDPENPELSIIMLSYNALKYTKGAIKSIRENTNCNYELIVIDNNSTDGSAEWLEGYLGEFDNVKFVKSSENLGVAGGRNRGIELARGDYVMFLDNDVEVYPHWDRAVLSEFTNDQIGIVGRTGANVPSLKPIQFESVEEGDCDVVSGYCFAFRRELIELIGNKWTDFPNGKFWHEDLEFCMRAREAGLKVYAKSSIPMTHFEHKSMGDNVKGSESIEAVEGFHENADYILKRFVSSNMIEYRRNWEGFDHWSSYDRIARGLSRSMRDAGYVVCRTPSIHDSPFSFNLCKGVDWIFNGQRIVSLFLENDKPPEDWADAMKHVDLVLAGSRHFYQATRELEYADKVVDVSPVGIESDIYNMSVEPLNDFYPDKFKFLMVGASQPRKGQWDLIEWYCETFSSDDDVVLIIKDGDYGFRKETESVIAKCTSKPNAPEVAHIWEHWSSEYLAQVYRTVGLHGCYIHPHRGEGFGMPHIEAVACGCRVGTTDFGGPKYNLMGLNGVTSFGYELQDSIFHNNRQEKFYKSHENPQWAVPFKKDVTDFMQMVYSEEHHEDVALFDSQQIINEFNYDAVADRIISELLEYV